MEPYFPAAEKTKTKSGNTEYIYQKYIPETYDKV